MTERDVVVSVVDYFSEPQFNGLSVDTENTARELCVIQFGSGGGHRNGIADVVLHRDGHLVAIAECKKYPPTSQELERRQRDQLKSYLSATGTRFGVLAYSTSSEKWIFCENLGGNQFRVISQSDFEQGVVDVTTEDPEPKSNRKWQYITIGMAVALVISVVFLIMVFRKQPSLLPIPLTEVETIHAGEFQMGSDNIDAEDDEQPVRSIYLDTFYIDRYEVTNAQYKRFVDANPKWQKDRIPSEYHDGDYLKHWEENNYPQGKENHPVVYVIWYAAMAYADWVDKRLPTEAEWEKAARGGLVGQVYPWGNSIDLSKANYSGEIGDTTPVGSYPANAYGLYDIAGNAWEWCLDVYETDFYTRAPRRNPIAGGLLTEIVEAYHTVRGSRVLRSGYWNNPAVFVRVADRYKRSPDSTHRGAGFRCVMSITR